MIEEAARKHFKHVEVRDGLIMGEYFLDKKFDVQYWTVIEWIRGDFFVDEYFRGLAEYGDEIFLCVEPDRWAYWCEGVKHRPKKLDNANWTDVKDHAEALANMASNALDSGLSMILPDAEFSRVEILAPWDSEDDFMPKIAELKPMFKGWQSQVRFRPVYKFDKWGIEGWMRVV